MNMIDIFTGIIFETGTREVPLTQRQVAIVDAELFPIVSRYKWYAEYHSREHGYYAVRKYKVNGVYKMMRMHRFIWECVFGPIPKGLEMDHINNNGFDNRLKNLELVTHQENIKRQYARRIMSSKSLKRGKYTMKIFRPKTP